MPKIWVLVADTTRARVFSANKTLGPIQEVDTLVHVESRLHEQELTSDPRPGRNLGGNGNSHSMGHETDPKKQEGIRFAKQICDYLNSAHAERRFERLYIMAAPTFLGELRHNLSKPVRQMPADRTRVHARDVLGDLVGYGLGDRLEHDKASSS